MYEQETYDGVQARTYKPKDRMPFPLSNRAVVVSTVATPRLFAWIVIFGIFSIIPTSTCLFLESVKNLRPVLPGVPLYRAASLDNLSLADAKGLLDGSAFNESGQPLAAVIDLRNSDEIQKGAKARSDGAMFFYSQLLDTTGNSEGSSNSNTRSNSNSNSNITPRLYHEPLLEDVDAFWNEAIDRMPTLSRIKATLETAVTGGALDRAAARNLEMGGLAMLYTILLTTAPRRVRNVLTICTRKGGDSNGDGVVGPIIFHCQKGKDRTGIVAMLLQSCLGASDEDILEAYGISGDLLGGEDASIRVQANQENGSSSSTSSMDGGGTMVDWSQLRGSPPSAMADTMEWVREKHGSVEEYLEDTVSFGKDLQNDFRERMPSKATL